MARYITCLALTAVFLHPLQSCDGQCMPEITVQLSLFAAVPVSVPGATATSSNSIGLYGVGAHGSPRSRLLHWRVTCISNG